MNARQKKVATVAVIGLLAIGGIVWWRRGKAANAAAGRAGNGAAYGDPLTGGGFAGGFSSGFPDDKQSAPGNPVYVGSSPDTSGQSVNSAGTPTAPTSDAYAAPSYSFAATDAPGSGSVLLNDQGQLINTNTGQTSNIYNTYPVSGFTFGPTVASHGYFASGDTILSPSVAAAAPAPNPTVTTQPAPDVSRFLFSGPTAFLH